MKRQDGKRLPTALVVPCLFDGQTTTVSVYNVSEGGAFVEWLEISPPVGACLVLKFEGLTSAIATLRWKTEMQGGCEFKTTLHQSVVEYLGFSASKCDFARIEPRDAMGRAIAVVSTPEPTASCQPGVTAQLSAANMQRKMHQSAFKRRA